MTGTGARDYITNSGSKVTIEGAGGDDTIEGSEFGELIYFASNGGNDLVTNFGANDSLRITAGSLQSTIVLNDDILVNVKGAKYSGSITLGNAASLAGQYLYFDAVNPINNSRSNYKVTGTGARDYITNSGENVTIQGGGGNDTFEGSDHGELYLFSSADGDNVITNFSDGDSLRMTAGKTLTCTIDGDDVLVSLVGANYKGSVRLIDAAELPLTLVGNVLAADKVNPIIRSEDRLRITGTDGRDSIVSSGDRVTIDSKGGNDTITGSDEFGEMYLFASNYGNNVVTNFGKNDTLRVIAGNLRSVEMADGNAIVSMKGATASGTVTLQGAGDYTFIQNGNTLTAVPYNVSVNNRDGVKFTGSGDADSLYNTGANVTIQGNGGNDTITGSEHGEWYLFASNHGDNVVTNFGVNDSLKCTGGSIATVRTVGNNAVVSLKGAKYSGSVTLVGASDYDFVQSGNVLTVKHANEMSNDKDGERFTGTGGDDYMINSGENVTIQGAGGDDTIEGTNDGNTLYRFGAADGNDVIYNFSRSDTLRVTSGNIESYYADGADYIIEVASGSASGSVRLKDVGAVSVSGKNVRATRFNAQLPSEEYWFESDASEDELVGMLMTDGNEMSMSDVSDECFPIARARLEDPTLVMRHSD